MQGYADGVDSGYDDGVGGAYRDGTSNNPAAYADAQAYTASGYAGLSRADPSASLGTTAGTDTARANVESLSRPLIASGTTGAAQRGNRHSNGRGADGQREEGMRAGHGDGHPEQMDEGCCCLVM